MKRLQVISIRILACLLAIGIVDAENVLKSVALPTGEGAIVGAAFSPDSSRLALIRHLPAAGASIARRVIQVVEPRSGQEVAHADVPGAEPSMGSDSHFIKYSPDGRYLLLAKRGSDVLSIIDATTLRGVRRLVLHPETDGRVLLGPRRRHFRGIVSLTSSLHADRFGVLTYDTEQDNEVFVGSFTSGKIIQRWSLGEGRIITQLGQTS